MKVKRSYFLSLLLLLIVGAWLASGQLERSSANVESSDEASPVSPETASVMPTRVMVAALTARKVPVEVVVQGQLEPNRRLPLRAETSSQVSEIMVRKGQAVEQGELLIRLSRDDRPARVAQARASLAQQQLNLEGARRLFERKMQSESQVKLAEAAVAAAEAGLEMARIDLNRTRISAPFAGLVEAVPIELGSFVDRGDVVVDLVDNQRLKAVGYVPQQSVSGLKLGQTVKVQMLDGRSVEAELEFISQVAENNTRSFRVEALVETDGGPMSAGISAEMRIRTGESLAHFLSPAVLTLDVGGQVGVKVVEAGNKVNFYPVSLVRTEPAGVWVSGLPDQVTLIVRGQNFVSRNQVVIPVPRA